MQNSDEALLSICPGYIVYAIENALNSLNNNDTMYIFIKYC